MSSVQGAPVPTNARAMVVVDAALADLIGNPAAPRSLPMRVTPPDSVPGERGAWAAASELYGQLRHGVRAYAELRARYGDVHYFRFAFEPMVAVWDPDAINAILRNEDNVWSAGLGWDSVFAGLDPSGDNLSFLSSLDFDVHRSARKLVQPAFTANAIKGYIDLAAHHLDATIPSWIARGRIDFKHEVRALLARVANSIFTGLEDPAQVALVDRLLRESWRFPQAIVKHQLGLTYRRGQRSHARLRAFFRELLPARRRATGADLFSRLCQAQDTEGVSDDAVVGIFVGIMAGAYDTTSAAVASMAYLLATHPEWQERMGAELATVSDDARDWNALKKLEVSERVWKETLRLMPVSAFIPRRALREVELGGHRLAAGTAVAAAVGVIGHHPTWWTNPTQFDPDRFALERAEDKRHPALFLPFGAGAHGCVGMQLAGIEAKLLWHALLTRCRFTLTEPYRAEHTYTPLGCVSGRVGISLRGV